MGSPERFKIGKIEGLQRLDIIIDALHEGKIAIEIDEILAAHHNRFTRQRGLESEQRAIQALREVSSVKEVVKGSSQDDHHKVDAWAFPSTSTGLSRPIPVQIKSSEERKRAFIKSKEYQQYGGYVIVVVAGPRKTDEEIVRSIKEETVRIIESLS